MENVQTKRDWAGKLYGGLNVAGGLSIAPIGAVGKIAGFGIAAAGCAVATVGGLAVMAGCAINRSADEILMMTESSVSKGLSAFK